MYMYGMDKVMGYGLFSVVRDLFSGKGKLL